MSKFKTLKKMFSEEQLEIITSFVRQRELKARLEELDECKIVLEKNFYRSRKRVLEKELEEIKESLFERNNYTDEEKQLNGEVLQVIVAKK
ncbi:MAG: hypothetical protein ACOCUI_02440 [bacterium]